MDQRLETLDRVRHDELMRAAEQLHLTQPGRDETNQALEALYGVRLLPTTAESP